MAKTLHNSKRTKKIGLLTDTQRTAIKNNTVNKTMKWKMMDLEKGRLITDLRAVVEDLRLILNSPKFDYWKLEYRVVQELNNLEEIVNESQRCAHIPKERIAATKIENKRMFYLKAVMLKECLGLEKNSKDRILVKGLKSAESRLIKEYITKNSYNFPLEDGKYYSWLDVKKRLKEKMETRQKPVENVIREEFQKRMNIAWDMIREKLSKEFENEIINKTGFGIKLLQYKQSLKK